MLLRHIRYLLAVAEHRNFTRAAQALHVSQPTLSQQIRQLEEALGALLLDRTGRSIRLTDAGEAYVSHARRALQQLESGKRAISDVQDLSRGVLHIAATPTFTAYFVGPLIEAFNRLHPKIMLSFTEMPQDRMEALLSDDALDVGIAFDTVSNEEIEPQVLFVEELALMIGKAHPRARGQLGMTLNELKEEPLILLNGEFATRRYIDRYFRENGVAPRLAMEVNSISAAIEVVSRSALATLLPAAITREHRELCSVQLEPALPQRTAALLLRKSGYRSAATRAFVALSVLQSDAERAAGKRVKRSKRPTTE
jgi:LysR family cyn operon transcriptional activator